MGATTDSSQRRTVWAREDGRCHYCRRPFPDAEQTVDHVWPRKFGGRDCNANLVPACAPCNESLDARTDKCACAFCVNARALHEPVLEPLTATIGELVGHR